MEKKELVERLLAAKGASGKTYDEIADALGYCNVYACPCLSADRDRHERYFLNIYYP